MGRDFNSEKLSKRECHTSFETIFGQCLTVLHRKWADLKIRRSQLGSETALYAIE